MLSLFIIMLVLAAIPSTSVGLVVARSATGGIRNGVAASFGIVLADLFFVVLAILSMTALAETLGSFFMVIRYLAGGYLIWMGIGLLRSVPGTELSVPCSSSGSIITSFSAGFFLTLGDVKAIFFYASLFPAFIDLSQLTVQDGVAIMGITILTVGGVKVGYAILSRRIVERIRNREFLRAGRIVSGSLMVGVGAYLITES